MKLNNRFIFGILSLLLAAVIAFVALPTIARQTNGKEEIVRKMCIRDSNGGLQGFRHQPGVQCRGWTG